MAKVKVFLFGAENENGFWAEVKEEGREVFVPFSVCSKRTKNPRGGGEMVIEDWFCEKEDL